MSAMAERVRVVGTNGTHDHRKADQLADAPFLAYALVQAFKLFIGIVGKRWPELR